MALPHITRFWCSIIYSNVARTKSASWPMQSKSLWFLFKRAMFNIVMKACCTLGEPSFRTPQIWAMLTYSSTDSKSCGLTLMMWDKAIAPVLLKPSFSPLINMSSNCLHVLGVASRCPADILYAAMFSTALHAKYLTVWSSYAFKLWVSAEIASSEMFHIYELVSSSSYVAA